jgi:hypothetical protein
MDHAQAQKTYGLDAAEWLSRWDNNEIVWTVEMGGLGPGYEQVIQIASAEVLRIMIAENFDHQRWGDTEKWDKDRDRINELAHHKETKITDLGLSGAQWGAVLSLATQMYMRDPWVVFTDDRIKDRLVQVQKEFPSG